MRKYEEQPAREPEHKAERTRARDSNKRDRKERGRQFMQVQK